MDKKLVAKELLKIATLLQAGDNEVHVKKMKTALHTLALELAAYKNSLGFNTETERQKTMANIDIFVNLTTLARIESKGN